MGYTDQHRIVLQTIMHKGALNENNAKALIMKLFGHHNIKQIINEINVQLQPLYMIIKCTNCEVTGELYWVFTNIVQDKIASFNPEFNQDQLALLRNIYSEIITCNDNCVSSTWCLNLCPSPNLKLTKADADHFLHEMIDRKWLCCKSGKYYIGVRSIVELHQYFKDTYENNLRACTLCNQLLFYGKKCDRCNATTHIYCLNDYTKNGGLGCPSCHCSIPESSDCHSQKNSNNTNTSTMDFGTDVQISESHADSVQSGRRSSKRKHKN